MTSLPINPLTGAPLQGGQVQEQQSAEKARQVRRAQSVARNVASEGDRFEHQVESTEQLPVVGDRQNPQGNSQQKRKPPAQPPLADGDAHLDVTA
jgi:hypothetical protein